MRAEQSMQTRSNAFFRFVAALGLAAVLVSVWWWRAQDESVAGALYSASTSQAELAKLIGESRVQSDAAALLMKRKAEVISLAMEFRQANRVAEANRVLDTLPSLTTQLNDHLQHAVEAQVQASLKRVEADRLDAHAAVERRFAEKHERLSIAGLCIGILLLALGCFGWGRDRRGEVIALQSLPQGK
ncbi:hypothetical protein QTI66_35105 [Variovorax sp. J22R133]|uniref:hypothetical protein n=1 Tax=Variovorax brevis TaxID=3053503 RepID=UPI00257574E0|nr:hypothetical protein [Variovorax sp. J22R133]MDM0117348.1 hypothetical protein [Variovorax sp. J22R133]